MSVYLAADAYGLTTGRVVGGAAALIALAGVILGGLALTGRLRRRGTIGAIVTGLTGLLGGGVVVAAANGGPGTGYGIVGGFLAVVLGLIATAIGWLALARARRTV